MAGNGSEPYRVFVMLGIIPVCKIPVQRPGGRGYLPFFFKTMFCAGWEISEWSWLSGAASSKKKLKKKFFFLQY
jgi:hypothetical protein